MSNDSRRVWVTLECGYAHSIASDVSLPKVGDQYLCGKHHSEHAVTAVFSSMAAENQ